MKTIRQNLRKYIAISIMVIFMSASLSACDTTPQSPKPSAQKGNFLATDWVFKTKNGLEVSGEWEVIWGKLVAPEDFDAAYQGDYFQLPNRWNMQTRPEIDGSYGAATFRVKLNLPAYGPDLSFHMISPHSAWQIYVDGQAVHRNGVPSTDPNTFRPHYATSLFPAKDGQSTVVLHVANFSHAYGGPGHPLTVWDAQNLRKTLDFLSLYYVVTMGILLTIGLFHLIIYIADRKHRENGPVHLWFFLMCMVIVYRVSGAIPYFYIYFQDASYWASLRLSYISLLISPAVYLLFFKSAFPKIFPKRVTNFLIGLSLACTCIVLVTPETFYTHSRNFAILLNIFAVFYSLVFTARAWRQKEIGAGAILIANSAFFITALNDAFIYSDNSNGFDLTPFGFLILGMGYSYALLLRLQVAFRQAHTTSKALETLNAELEKQVKERTSSFKAAAAKARNSASDQAKFIAAASHDLRQPLHALALFNQAITRKIQKNVKPKTLADLIGKQEKSIRSLSDLLQDTLDTATLDSGQKIPNFTQINPKNLLTELARDFDVRARTRGITLTVKTDTGTLVSDKGMLKRVLGNLLDNALKAARTQVHITAAHTQTDWIFNVTDDGGGILPEDVKRIFAPYVSAEDSPNTQGGYGLGLFVVNEFSRALGGHVNIEQSTKKGSHFVLTLPHKPNTHLEVQPKPANKKVFSHTGLKVLVIDDELDILGAVDILLSEWQCSVQTAHDVDAATVHIKAGFLPDILIVDYHLHTQSGLDAIADVRAIAKTDIPAMIITGATEPVILSEIETSGFSYLLKPIDPQALSLALLKFNNN